MMKSDNFLSNLGLAKRAQVLITGEQLFKNLKTVKCLILATDASEKTKERVYKKAHFYELKVIEKYSSHELSHAIAARNRMVIGVTHPDFCKMLCD